MLFFGTAFTGLAGVPIGASAAVGNRGRYRIKADDEAQAAPSSPSPMLRRPALQRVRVTLTRPEWRS
jgi:hypothetical protein